MNDLYPVYIILFSNNTEFGKLIRKVTGSDYSHAVISLDSTMNNMYSFSDIPYSHAGFKSAGFVRESLWSPMYRRNRYFTILVTFVKKEERDIIQSKINYFCDNYTRFKYNDIGLIQYYLNFKERKGHSEEKKKFWFCSEFVAYMLKSGHVDKFDDILLSPGDIKNIDNPNVYNLGDFTIRGFKESILIKKTEEAKKKFIENIQGTIIKESFYFDYVDIVTETGIRDIIKIKKKKFKESEIHQYTQLIDWKMLYDEFIKLFPDTDPNVRFDLYELIVRKILVPFKRAATNATREIYAEVMNIFKVIGKCIIAAVEVDKSYIHVTKSNKKITYSYPIMNTVAESYDDIETLNNIYPGLSQNIKTDMAETFFE